MSKELDAFQRLRNTHKKLGYGFISEAEYEDYETIKEKLQAIDNVRKSITLTSYSQHDEFNDRDYMVYEVKYSNGFKEYVSREIFMFLKEIINE